MPNFAPIDSITQLAGLAGKHPVRVATTENIILTGTPPTHIDGVELELNDRVLVWQQTALSENGIYRVVSGGDLVRTYDLFISAELFAGLSTYVASGTMHAKKIFHLTTTGTLSIGVSNITFEVLAPTMPEFGNGLSEVTGVIGLGGVLDRSTYIDGWTNSMPFSIEAPNIQIYAPDSTWETWAFHGMRTDNIGGNMHPFQELSNYFESFVGDAYSYEQVFTMRRDPSQLTVGEFQFLLSNDLNGPTVNAQMNLRNNNSGRYLDLGYDQGAANYSMNMALRLGRFAGDAADGLLDSDAVLYYDSVTSKLRGKEGGVWKDLVQDEATNIPEVLVTNSFNEEDGLNLALKTSAYLVLPVPKYSVNKIDFFIPMRNSLNGDSIVETAFVITGAAAASSYKPQLVCELRYPKTSGNDGSTIVLSRIIQDYTELTTQYAWDDHPDWAALMTDLGGSNGSHYFELRIHGTLALEDSVNGGDIAFAFYTQEGYAGTYMSIKSGAYASLMYIDEEGTPP